MSNFVGMQQGANGHSEFAWSVSDLQEQISQFYFQSVRCSDDALYQLSRKLDNILCNIKSKGFQETVTKEYLVVLYRLIGLTRDVKSGKGERDLSYIMILVWDKYFPELARFALSRFVLSHSPGVEPYGSWKDIKKFCAFLHKRGLSDCELVEYAVRLVCDQLRLDSALGDDCRLSLCAKWVPRESSSCAWLFRKMAISYFPEILATAKTPQSKEKAVTKVYMMFSRMIAGLNRRLNTVQIKMCDRTWSEIDPNKVPSVALTKNRKAFLNFKKSDDYDRVECAENFSKYLVSRVSTGATVKGSRVGIVDFVRAAASSVGFAENMLLNAQWSDFMSKVGDLGSVVAMVDQSGSMAGDPYDAAMGLGIAIASKSAIGKRVMTFSTTPTWISLDGCDSLTDYVKVLKKYDMHSGLGTDFFKALDCLLFACVAAKLSDDVVGGMTLVILSDMQIDSCTNTVNSGISDSASSFETKMISMQERISIKYRAAGYTRVPHLLFWNLRFTGGFPSLSSCQNTTMFSGFSPVLLNSFCHKGIDALKETSPWSSLVELVRASRYDILEEVINL
jgi:hypothetical protein